MLNHKGTITLYTERLELRRFKDGSFGDYVMYGLLKKYRYCK